MTTSVLAWHWLNSSRTLGYGDGRTVVDGETLSIPDDDRMPKCCEYGMHASERIVDALRYAPGCVLTQVEVSCDISSQEDKLVGRSRRVLWSLTGQQGLDLVVTFARWCAVRAATSAAANAAAVVVVCAAAYDAASAASRAATAYDATTAHNAAACTVRAAADAAALAAAYAAANAAAEREAQEQWLITEVTHIHGGSL
jgi:hypothetical protein